ncbi:MAG: ABC transporter ATP-binding protein [Candidatus Omnitrophica bacterium]|nr:ABC transporter ATP-binding protein [Candidatus Omnitrophota bacterium]
MIEIINLCKAFGSHAVLDNLNLTVQTGETMVIIGRSGCGKSVLLKHVLGLMRPDSGQVIVDGKDVTKIEGPELQKLRMRFGMVFQGAALFDSMTVGENVGFALREHRLFPEGEVRRRITECLSLVGLADIENLKPAELSGGMRKRVGIARALAIRPDILLFDEPTTGIDPVMADVINKLVKTLHERLKVTVVLVTHDMVSAYKVATRIAMMYEGRIIATGTPEQIQSTGNPVVRQFVRGEAEGPITADQPKRRTFIG